jgi:hypothetical protein
VILGGFAWVFLSKNDPFGRLVCIALVGFAADHLAGFDIVRRGDCVGGVVQWLGFGNGHVERADRSSLLKRCSLLAGWAGLGMCLSGLASIVQAGLVWISASLV